jgi:hypothetical protein
MISSDPIIQERYERMVANGVAPRLAETLAFRQAPASKSDREFFAGRRNGEEFTRGKKAEVYGEFLLREAKRHGFNPKGKTYISGLAEFAGDPKAWVDSTGDIVRQCEQRGLDCNGSITVDSPVVAPKAKPRVADDVVNREAMRLKRLDPGLDLKKVRREVREQLSGDMGIYDTTDRE